MERTSPPQPVPAAQILKKENQMKFVVLNGPPNCGKDTIANTTVELHGWRKYKIADPLKLGAHALLGDSLDIMKYEGLAKDEPQEDLFGKVPRDWYIYLSEEVLKKNFGKDILGHIAVKFLSRLPHAVVIVSDCGFMEELDPLINAFGAKNFYIVQMFRNGCTYANDSRGYLDLAPLFDRGCNVIALQCQENKFEENHLELINLLKKEGFFNGT